MVFYCTFGICCHPIVFEGVNPDIADMAILLTPEVVAELKELSNTEPAGIISASTNFSEGRMQEKGELDHYIGVVSTGNFTGVEINSKQNLAEPIKAILKKLNTIKYFVNSKIYFIHYSKIRTIYKQLLTLGQEMKNLLLAISEVIVVWVALGLFTNKWGGNRRIAMDLEIILYIMFN